MNAIKRRSNKSAFKRKRTSNKLAISKRLFTARNFGLQVFRYRQSVSGQTISGIANNNISQLVGPQGFMATFALQDTAQSATFTALYDSYRIRKVVLRLYPQKQYHVTPDTIVGGLPVTGAILTAIDHDGGAVPAAIGDVMQYSTCQMQNVYTQDPIVRTVYPNPNGGVYNGVVIAQASNLSNTTWINCSQPGVPYNGIAIYVEGYASAVTPQSWRIFADYYIEFKGVR